ncbi:hypothetical protein LUD75_08125 [Epilithonimonas sp. JDS]|uniref:hypothetical protein n=1 Tax=Epilithonimonas sp. JDS TaxID=2902797 RepID=UPI001E49C993|nr:hypothetical protein [Epilithonimonas sp. JDS]MCD9854671.1 hypothetical protein [Epilithonimonas sp. JDS]
MLVQILQNFEDEIIELFKAYRMAHFSLYNMKSTFYQYKECNSQLENLVLKDIDFETEVAFNEEEINKNNENGIYQRIIAGNTIAMFYNIWEDKYRVEIAKILNLNKNEIRSKFFKELNIIRQSIVHNSFNPITKLDTLEKFSFIGNSSILKLSSFEVQNVYILILREIQNLKTLDFT